MLDSPYLNSAGELGSFSINYEQSGKYTDIWKEYGTYEDSWMNGAYRVCYYNPGAAIFDYLGIYITQTFFNDDENYEYVITYYKKDKWEQISEDGGNKTVYEGDRDAGIKIINDKGQVLQTIETENPYPEFYTIGKNNYVAMGDALYKVNKGTTSLTKVAMPTGMTVNPSIAKRNTPVEVSLGASEVERTISVVGVNGMTYQTLRVGAGISSTTIDTARMPAGMYVVVMQDGGRNIEKCKIVIR